VLVARVRILPASRMVKEQACDVWRYLEFCQLGSDHMSETVVEVGWLNLALNLPCKFDHIAFMQRPTQHGASFTMLAQHPLASFGKGMGVLRLFLEPTGGVQYQSSPMSSQRMLRMAPRRLPVISSSLRNLP
jgi:hypothetical protein